MGSSIAKASASVEVNRVHDDESERERVVNKVHRLAGVPLAMAKAKVGAAVSAAIGDEPLKAFGHVGLVSAVCSGEKVPDYLARIVQDKDSRRRLALALLTDDTDVVVTTTVTFPQKR